MKIKKYNQFINENKIEEIPLPKDIIEISNAYIKAGKDIFLVGGAVRDFIQGIKPKDYDLVTNALPEESKQILKGFNVSDEQGKNFGVLRVYTKDEPAGYEIASYRRDISKGRDTKGEDQKVEMGNDVTIDDDCRRRDLTMNALFYDIKNKKIVDLVGGVDDIKNKVVKSVGDPNERFIEDRLRICRIFRFTARIGGEIDSKTAQGIRKDNRLKGIGPKDDVSQERIWEEFKKAWKQSKDYNHYLNFYTDFNMWEQVFPGSNINTDLVNSEDFIVVIANLFKNENISGLSNRLIQDYKIESEVANKVIFLINFLDFNTELVFDFYKKKQQCDISNNTILEWLRVQNINDNTLIKFTEYLPSVSSQELISKGFSGRELGLKIKELEIRKFKEIINESLSWEEDINIKNIIKFIPDSDIPSETIFFKKIKNYYVYVEGWCDRCFSNYFDLSDIDRETLIDEFIDIAKERTPYILNELSNLPQNKFLKNYKLIHYDLVEFPNNFLNYCASIGIFKKIN